MESLHSACVYFLLISKAPAVSEESAEGYVEKEAHG